jgi:AcrR family transcriptional regulator
MPERTSAQFDSNLDRILRRAAEVFCARGYHRASIRDISRATRVSLAGLYYYFSSKDELLFLIQRHAFETILKQARTGLAPLAEPEERLRTLVSLHLTYFIQHPHEMKVLTHEESALGAKWRREIHALKKNYYQLCWDVVEELRRSRKLKVMNTRLAVLSLFGMMNWIYTWYNPKVDPGAEMMAGEMAGLFLHGLLGRRSERAGRNGGPRRRMHPNGAHPDESFAQVRGARNPAPPGVSIRNSKEV